MSRSARQDVDRQRAAVAAVVSAREGGMDRAAIAQAYEARYGTRIAQRTLQRRLEELVAAGVMVPAGASTARTYHPTPGWAGAAPDLAELTRRVVQAVDPERIILFGSAARGAAGPHSDLDVLVIKSGTRRRIELMHAIRRALRGFPAAVDLVVATPTEIARWGEHPGLVFHQALGEGVELYAA